MKESDEVRMTRLWQPPARQANAEWIVGASCLKSGAAPTARREHAKNFGAAPHSTTGPYQEKRCEDSSHSKSTPCEIHRVLLLISGSFGSAHSLPACARASSRRFWEQ
jgi:hypothetical protein